MEFRSLSGSEKEQKKNFQTDRTKMHLKILNYVDKWLIYYQTLETSILSFSHNVFPSLPKQFSL